MGVILHMLPVSEALRFMEGQIGVLQVRSKAGGIMPALQFPHGLKPTGRICAYPSMQGDSGPTNMSRATCGMSFLRCGIHGPVHSAWRMFPFRCSVRKTTQGR
jgi:hypothetical protein